MVVPSFPASKGMFTWTRNRVDPLPVNGRCAISFSIRMAIWEAKRQCPQIILIVMPFRHAGLSEELPITSRLQTLPTFVRVDVVPLLVQTHFSAMLYLSLDF